MNTTETWTVGRLLSWTTEYLKKHGSESPRLDAEVLLAHALGCERIGLYTTFTEETSEQNRAAFREMVRRRSEGTPVAYLVGYKEFYSDRFEVNPDVLIPRPETEHLVLQALDSAKRLTAARGQASLRIADVGTGSGIVAITLAKHLPEARLFAIDQSPAALAIAERNIASHALQERVQIVEGDLFTDFVPEETFDLIVSNPPYVSEAEFTVLPATVREYEPRQALVAGPTGFEVIDRLVAQSVHRLRDDGYLILELSPMLAPDLASRIGSAWRIESITKDLAGLERIATLRLLQPSSPSPSNS